MAIILEVRTLGHILLTASLGECSECNERNEPDGAVRWENMAKGEYGMVLTGRSGRVYRYEPNDRTTFTAHPVSVTRPFPPLPYVPCGSFTHWAHIPTVNSRQQRK